jgi:3-hydroxy-9,10-secoandrosta-1,3,5(10)-triene-9,17-dione monooxygenase
MSVSKQDLVDRAKSLAPGIAARALETERLRRPHDDTIQELIDAELMQTLVPRHWGGHELGLETHLEVVEVLGAACMSTGWIAAFYMGHNWFATKFSERAQKEIFGDRPFGLIPASSAPTLRAVQVDGGWEVAGRATWSSGIMHADWVMMGGLTDKGPMQFLLPIEDVHVEDVWHMSAMAGTGSNDAVVDGAFVPDYRSLTAIEFAGGISEGSKLHENPLYSIPLLPFIYCEIIGLFSGGLRGAVTAFEEMVQSRVTSHAAAALREKQHVHITLGEAHARAAVAETLARAQIASTEKVMNGSGFDLDARLGLKLQASFVIDQCRQTVNDLAHRSGSSNFRVDAPIQRFFRDINMLATHAFWDWETSRELFGRHRLGLEPNFPLI